MMSDEETDIMNKFVESDKLRKSALKDEREQEVARNMVSRGLLNRQKDDDGIYFVVNDNKGAWRF